MVSYMNEVGAIKDRKQIEKIKIFLKKNNSRDYLLFVLGINTGLRISDLLTLKYQDVAEGPNKILDIIQIKEKKTSKTKLFYINDSAKKALHDYIKETGFDPNRYLFSSRKGNSQPITRVQAYRIINDACAVARVEGAIGMHTLRKTFGYWAYKQGIDIILLMKIFNHSSPSITLRYIGITQEDINNVYISLNL